MWTDYVYVIVYVSASLYRRTKTLMKYFTFLLLSFLLIAMSNEKAWSQNNKSYDSDWKKVDDLIQKRNLPQSALAEVKKIYARAKKEGRDAEVIRSLVYII